MRLYRLSPDSLHFPPPHAALSEPNGLLAFGSDLSPQRLLRAYRQGIFPWYSPGDAILWWSPDPRAVLFPHAFHHSRSFSRFSRRCRWRVTLNQAFAAVVAACAERGTEGSWIGPEVEIAYGHLHQLGHAHSVEVWDDETLVGGLYGVAQGAIFFGESMFSRRPNASKLALASFCRYFMHQGGKMVDCQVLNAHTASLGAHNIARGDFLAMLTQLLPLSLAAGCWQPQTLSTVLPDSESGR